MDNDIKIYKNTPLAFTIKSELKPEGDIFYGYITNLKEQPTLASNLENMKEIEMDVTSEKDPVTEIYKFKHMKITPDELLLVQDVLDDDGELGTDYLRYKNPKQANKIGNSIREKEDKKITSANEAFQKQNKLLWVLLGAGFAIFLISYIAYAMIFMH